MGCLSFVNAAFELKQQIEQGLLPEPDHIICPVGSSGTLAGLALGCQLAGLKSKVIGIRVAPSHLGIIPICTTETVTSLMNKTYAHLRSLDKSIPKISLNKIHLDDDYYGEGYGFSIEEGDQAITAFEKRGIKLEATYTAKAAAAAIKLCCADSNKSVLYWHTFNSAKMDNELSTAQLNSLPKSLKNIINS
jgi:D-cysteine desulfhydrase